MKTGLYDWYYKFNLSIYTIQESDAKWHSAHFQNVVFFTSNIICDLVYILKTQTAKGKWGK